MADRKRFLLVVPVFAVVYAKPLANFLAIMLSAASREGHDYEFVPYVPERESLPSLMNRACELVIANKFDGMIVADDDCGPPFDAISRLLRRYESGYQIVLGMGFMRGFPHTTTIGRYFSEGATLTVDPTTKHMSWSGFEWIDDVSRVAGELTDNGMLKVDFGGFPIALIAREAIEKMQRPWFGLEIDGGACTHDVYFGKRASDAKVPIHVDTTIECSHLSEMIWVTFANRDIVRRVNEAWVASTAP